MADKKKKRNKKKNDPENHVETTEKEEHSLRLGVSVLRCRFNTEGSFFIVMYIHKQSLVSETEGHDSSTRILGKEERGKYAQSLRTEVQRGSHCLVFRRSEFNFLVPIGADNEFEVVLELHAVSGFECSSGQLVAIGTISSTSLRLDEGSNSTKYARLDMKRVAGDGYGGHVVLEICVGDHCAMDADDMQARPFRDYAIEPEEDARDPDHSSEQSDIDNAIEEAVNSIERVQSSHHSQLSSAELADILRPHFERQGRLLCQKLPLSNTAGQGTDLESRLREVQEAHKTQSRLYLQLQRKYRLAKNFRAVALKQEKVIGKLESLLESVLQHRHQESSTSEGETDDQVTHDNDRDDAENLKEAANDERFRDMSYEQLCSNFVRLEKIIMDKDEEVKRLRKLLHAADVELSETAAGFAQDLALMRARLESVNHDGESNKQSTN